MEPASGDSNMEPSQCTFFVKRFHAIDISDIRLWIHCHILTIDIAYEIRICTLLLTQFCFRRVDGIPAWHMNHLPLFSVQAD